MNRTIRLHRHFCSSGSAKANRIGTTTVPGSPQDILENSPKKILFNGETRSNMPTIDEQENLPPSDDEDEQDDDDDDDEATPVPMEEDPNDNCTSKNRVFSI